ncbi:MAG TPA: OmpA family protein [Burkholderiales bacterium]|jgi:OOP family OmpA-OmpF porin
MKLPLTLAASSLALSFSAFGQENQLPTEAFLGAPSDGRVIMDTYGNCVRTSQWSADKAIVGCGKAKPAPVATVAPQQAQPAPAPAAAAPAAESSAVAAPAAASSSAAPAAAAVAAVPIAAAASQNKPMRTVTVSGDAFFDTNKATFRKEAQPELEKISERVRNVTSVEAIQITGYTDNTGTADYNQKLSEQRAATVKDFLVKNGIDPSKITILGKGMNDPVADNATKEGRAKNRRVEVMVKGEVAGQ